MLEQDRAAPRKQKHTYLYPAPPRASRAPHR
jgi:hypothetical protein